MPIPAPHLGNPGLGWSIMVQSPSRKPKHPFGGATGDGPLSLFVEYSALIGLDPVLGPLVELT
jgi:hypothetical protein